MARKSVEATVTHKGKTVSMDDEVAMEQLASEVVKDAIGAVDLEVDRRPGAVAVLPKCAAEVTKACAKDSGRFALHAVQVVTMGSVTILTATDGRMLAVARYAHLETTPGMYCLVSGKDLADAIKFGKPNEEDGASLSLDENDSRLVIDMPRGQVSVPTAMGSFPNVRGVIPEHKTSKGLKAGSAIGMGVDVVPRAMEIAAKCVGRTDGGVSVWPGGERGPWRFDAEGEVGSCTVVWMPVVIPGTEAEEA